jgi:hypothetical protein
MKITAWNGEPIRLACDCGRLLEEDLEHGVFKCPNCKSLAIPVSDVEALVIDTMIELADLLQALAIAGHTKADLIRLSQALIG